MDIRIHLPVWEKLPREDLKYAKKFVERGWHIIINEQDVSRIRTGITPNHSLQFLLLEPTKRSLKTVVKGVTTKYLQWALFVVDDQDLVTNKKYFDTLEEVLQFLDE